MQLILIDGDVRRRAQISRSLANGGIHVEPFEDVSELILRWPRAGLILAHDDGATIATLIEHMGRSGGWLPVIAFAEMPALTRVVRAIHDGVIDYVAWPMDEGELTEMLRSAVEKGKKLTNAKLREAMARSRIERLSGREREVLGGVANGLSNELIAKQLGISSRTVEIHRANMLDKIGANHTSEAIRLAVEAALLN
jgi:FixJ family two-component response regulator